jgi:predicted metal-binding membrane protein
MSMFWMAVFALVMLAEQAAEMLAGRGLLVARAAGAVTVLVAVGLLLSPTPLPLVG